MTPSLSPSPSSACDASLDRGLAPQRSSVSSRVNILLAMSLVTAGLSSCSWLQKGLIDRANSTIVRRDALLEANGWIPTPPLGGPSGIGDIFSQRRGEFPTPELSDCFANEPTPHDRPNVDMNLTLETGVSVPFDEEELADAGLDGSGSRYESHVTFTDPTHWVMSRLDADLTEECASRLERLARVSPERFENMYVVNQVLMAEMTEKRCGQIDVDGNFIVLRPDISASLGCDIDSDGKQVLIGYQKVDLTSLPAVADIMNPISPPDREDRIREPLDTNPEWAHQDPNPSGRYVQIDASGDRTCALTNDGEIHCWGETQYDESEVPEGVFRQVVTSRHSTCALDLEDRLTCWGHSYRTEGHEMLSQISFTEIQMSPYGFVGCGIDEDGEVHCWGAKDYGDPAGRFTEITVGDYFSCGVLQGSQGVTCWGDVPRSFRNPRFGTFRKFIPSSPYSHVLNPDGRVHSWRSRIFSPPYFSKLEIPQDLSFRNVEPFQWDGDVCGLTTSGEVFCWNPHPREDFEYDLPSGTYQDFYPGGKFQCAGTDQGEVRCWGDLDKGRGDVPREQFKQVTIGYDHACGITYQGDIRCWGDNRHGQLNHPD